MLHEARPPLQPRTSLKGEECALFVLLLMLGLGTHWGPRMAQEDGCCGQKRMGLAEARQQALGSHCPLAFPSSLLLASAQHLETSLCARGCAATPHACQRPPLRTRSLSPAACALT